MIHVMIGTKAQFIKTAPVMKEMDKRGIEYNFIDSGQHAEITKELIRLFELKQPDVYLSAREEDVTTLIQAFMWFIKNASRGILRKTEIHKNVFRNKKGVCIIHGDTLSTLIGLILAKRVGIKVAHVEGGLRSYSYFHPFPEEIIRLTLNRYSNFLFASSEWAYNNAIRLNPKSKVFNIGENTIKDSIELALQKNIDFETLGGAYVVVTIHRFETIYSKKRLRQIIELLEWIAEKKKVIFVMHKPTKKRLTIYNLINKLENSKNIEITPLVEYPSFLKLIKNAEFIITDGGSIQEESFYLNVPCLLFRKKTERLEGLTSNVCLSEFKKEKIDYFIENYSDFKNANVREDYSPSKQIVDILEEYS